MKIDIKSDELNTEVEMYIIIVVPFLCIGHTGSFTCTVTFQCGLTTMTHNDTA